MTGDPTPPGLDRVKVSVAQSPMAPPRVVDVSPAVPLTGPAIEKL